MALHLFVRQKEHSEFCKRVHAIALAYFWSMCVIFIQEWQKVISISFQNNNDIAKENNFSDIIFG